MKPVQSEWIAVRRDLIRVGLQPVFTVTVFRCVPYFTASRTLLREKSGARDFRAKFWAAFRVMRLTDCEWEAAMLTKFTESASHFRGFRLGMARNGVDRFFASCGFLFLFIIPDILETYWGQIIPAWDCFLEVAWGYSFQTVLWWELSRIQAAVFGGRKCRRCRRRHCLLLCICESIRIKKNISIYWRTSPLCRAPMRYLFFILQPNTESSKS